ncbi:unnamed protein product [Cochlearia groenlandica]
MTQGVDISSLRFSPTDGKLVKILSDRIKKGKPHPYITDTETLYTKEPWLLKHVSHVNFKDNEWFYFVTRTRRLGVRNHEATTPSRKVIGSSGRWKSSTSLSSIDDKDGITIGFKQHIAFMVKKQETEKAEKATGWVMHEFRLNEPGFQQLVLCRIRFNKRRNNSQYAPRLASIIIGGETREDEEDGLALVKYNNKKNDLDDNASLVQETQYLDVPVVTQQDLNVSFSEYMGKESNFDRGMNQYQDFGDDLDTFLAQTISATSDFFMETQQQYHNLVGNLAFEKQQQHLQAMEEGINEEYLVGEADIDYELEFGNEEWAQPYNTPEEEEAELMAISSNLDVFINYFP